MPSKKSMIIGLIGGGTLFALYLGVLTIVNSFSHALEQFGEVWYWVLLLTTGFGIQVGLYSYIRASLHTRIVAATAEVATTGGVSVGSMIACCVHHISDVSPFIGLSAAGVFLTRYQLPFILLGVFSNLVGMTMMLGIIQKHGLFDQSKSFLKKIFRYNMKIIRNITIILSLLILSAIFIKTTLKDRIIDLPSKINEENGVSIEVTPKDFSLTRPVEFEVAINTHEGSLDFDLAQLTVLEDGDGNKYLPLKWEGSPPGGHHRSGFLSFPKLKAETKYLKLIIKDVSGVPQRIFVWEIE